jgi:hypothetical protein
MYELIRHEFSLLISSYIGNQMWTIDNGLHLSLTETKILVFKRSNEHLGI